MGRLSFEEDCFADDVPRGSDPAGHIRAGIAAEGIEGAFKKVDGAEEFLFRFVGHGK